MEFTPVCYDPEPTALVNVTPSRTKRLKKQSPAEQARWVGLWQKSGMTQTAFCQQYGIAIKTFSRWKCKVIHRQSESNLPKRSDTDKIEKHTTDKNRTVVTSLQPTQSALANSTIQFQARIPNGVVLTFDAVPAATAIHLIRGLCDAHSAKRA